MGRLSTLLRGEFETAVRARGNVYFFSRAVEITAADGQRLRAVVQGSRRYAVSLDWTGSAFAASCECPQFRDGVRCKHIWATILTADAKHALLPPAGQADALVEHALEPRPVWEASLAELASCAQPSRAGGERWTHGELQYVINAQLAPEGGQLQLELRHRRPKRNGEWGVARALAVNLELLPSIPDPQDRQIVASLLGCNAHSVFDYGYYVYRQPRYSLFRPSHALAELLLPAICRSGRCWLQLSAEDLAPLALDEGPPYELRLEVTRDADEYVLSGRLGRGTERVDLAGPALYAPGWVFWPGRVARLADPASFQWITTLRSACPSRTASCSSTGCSASRSSLRSRCRPSCSPRR
jgi:hypothetical protein